MTSNPPIASFAEASRESESRVNQPKSANVKFVEDQNALTVRASMLGKQREPEVPHANTVASAETMADIAAGKPESEIKGSMERSGQKETGCPSDQKLIEMRGNWHCVNHPLAWGVWATQGVSAGVFIMAFCFVHRKSAGGASSDSTTVGGEFE